MDKLYQSGASSGDFLQHDGSANAHATARDSDKRIEQLRREKLLLRLQQASECECDSEDDSSALSARILSLERLNARVLMRCATLEKELQHKVGLLRPLDLDAQQITGEGSSHLTGGGPARCDDVTRSVLPEEAVGIDASAVAMDWTEHITPEELQWRYNASVERNSWVVPTRCSDKSLFSSSAEGASEVMQRAASRREQRRKRLEHFTTCNAGERTPVLRSPLSQAATSIRVSGDSKDTDCDGHATASHCKRGGSDRALGRFLRNTCSAVSLCKAADLARALCNPNQIGAEILGQEKNCTWYTKQVLAQTLLSLVQPARREAVVAPSPSYSPPSPPFTSASPRSAPTGPEVLSDGARGEVRTACAAPSPKPPPAPLLYKEVNPQALLRAIEEAIPLCFHCADNAPVARPLHKRAPLGAFAHDRNTDADLLRSFSLPPGAQGADGTPLRGDRSSDAEAFREDEVCVLYHAPVVFNQIRGFLGADPDLLRLAVAQAVWRQSVSPGKSHTTLFYFGDYVMKTVRPSEFTFLCQRYLPAYAPYCERNPHTLLPRFYALLTMKWLKTGIAQHYILMQNVFTTQYYIHRIYDVKGSTIGRSALKPGKQPPRTAYGALLLKDNDLPPKLIVCGPYQRAILLAQLRSDMDFLKALNIVDYSCMIGVRSRVVARGDKEARGGGGVATLLRPPYPNRSASTSVDMPSHAAEDLSKTHHQTEGRGADVNLNHDLYVSLHGCDGGLLSLPIHDSDDDTTAREDVYYLGLIDVLQEYNSAKKLENFAKGLLTDRRQISVVPPKEYAERLYRVLDRITV